MDHNITDRLRQIIEYQFSDVASFSRKTGIPADSIFSWLRLGKIQNAHHFARIGNLGIDLNWLITGVGKPPEQFFPSKKDRLRL